MMMNKTSKMYNALLQELQTKAYDPSKNIHRKYTCRNDVGIIYSMSVASRMRALEFPADKMVKDTSFPVWQGVKIDLVTMPEYSHQNQMYIELQQMPGPDAYIFEIVADDLRRGIDTLQSSQGSTKRTLAILKKWKDFFSAGKLPILTGIKEQGLFGELLFLKELINDAGPSAVNTWSGVNNETHDFYVGQNAVEIKTTSKQAPYMAHINSEYQLDDHDVNGILFLRMYALRKDTNGGQRLPELINIIRRLIKDASSASRTFEEKIAKAGYLDAAEDYYHEGYTIRETYSFDVKKDFPRIVKKNLPNGIYNLEYSVAIAQCMDYAIEAKDLLRRIKE